MQLQNQKDELDKRKRHKKSIVISLVASAVFLVFIQPIMLFIWEVLKKFSSATFDGLINGMYRNAALGQRNWIDFILLTISLTIGMSFFLIVMFNLKMKVNDIQEERKLKDLTNDDAKEQLFATKIALENKIAKPEKKLILLYKSYWPSIILSAMCGLQILFSSYTDLQLNTSFNQR